MSLKVYSIGDKIGFTFWGGGKGAQNDGGRKAAPCSPIRAFSPRLIQKKTQIRDRSGEINSHHVIHLFLLYRKGNIGSLPDPRVHRHL